MSRKPLEMMVVNISEEGLKKKLKFMPRHVTATFSGTQVRALLELISEIETPHAPLLERVREISDARRVTLSRDEVQLLLTLALEVKQRS